MSQDILLYMMGGVAALLVAIIIAYIYINKNNKDKKYINQLQAGTKESSFSMEVMYQKLYMFYLKTPFLKRYILKLRRRLEIINLDDEYLTRNRASKILTKALLIIIPLTIGIIILTSKNLLLMCILLIFEVFMVDTVIDGMVDKIDNNLLKQQIHFFSQIRHAYNEFNMVEEAIYEVSQNDELEVSRQGEKIYEILISDNPEEELEKLSESELNSTILKVAHHRQKNF